MLPIRPDVEPSALQSESVLEKKSEPDLLPQNTDLLTVSNPISAPKEPVVTVAEFTESKFDLKDEDPEPKPFSVKQPLKPAPKPKPKPISQTQGTGTVVASHHQPTAFAAPEAWSDADFDSHDGTEIPELTMEEKSCRMCNYFHFEGGDRNEVRFGECRRSAPVGLGKAVWPSVLWESWCREWQMGVG